MAAFQTRAFAFLSSLTRSGRTCKGSGLRPRIRIQAGYQLAHQDGRFFGARVKLLAINEDGPMIPRGLRGVNGHYCMAASLGEGTRATGGERRSPGPAGRAAGRFDHHLGVGQFLVASAGFDAASLTDVMTTGLTGTSRCPARMPVCTCSMARTTSMPSVTRPKTQ